MKGVVFALETEDIRDADGLPRWIEGEDFIACANHQDVANAYTFMFEGFDLPDFDRWLSARKPSQAKTQLLEWRALAVKAARAGNKDAMLRYLGLIQLRRQYLDREAFLLPLARRGKAVADGGQKGGRKSAATRRGKASKHDAILAAATAYDGPETAKIASVARKAGATERYTRMVLDKEIRK